LFVVIIYDKKRQKVPTHAEGDNNNVITETIPNITLYVENYIWEVK